MRVSNIIPQEKFNETIQEGAYTIMPSKEAEDATKQSQEYTYYKVEYLKQGFKNTAFVAVWK